MGDREKERGKRRGPWRNRWVGGVLEQGVGEEWT